MDSYQFESITKRLDIIAEILARSLELKEKENGEKNGKTTPTNSRSSAI